MTWKAKCCASVLEAMHVKREEGGTVCMTMQEADGKQSEGEEKRLHRFDGGRGRKEACFLLAKECGLVFRAQRSTSIQCPSRETPEGQVDQRSGHPTPINPVMN
jgi:hypothetical protein